MIRGVAGSGEQLQGQPTKVHVLAVFHTGVFECQPCRCHRDDLRSGVRQFTGAGHEVGVNVCFHRKGQADILPLGPAQVRAKVTLRVDDRGAAVAQIDQVAGVTQTLVDDRHYLHQRRRCRCARGWGATRGQGQAATAGGTGAGLLGHALIPFTIQGVVHNGAGCRMTTPASEPGCGRTGGA